MLNAFKRKPVFLIFVSFANPSDSPSFAVFPVNCAFVNFKIAYLKSGTPNRIRACSRHVHRCAWSGTAESDLATPRLLVSPKLWQTNSYLFSKKNAIFEFVDFKTQVNKFYLWVYGHYTMVYTMQFSSVTDLWRAREISSWSSDLSWLNHFELQIFEVQL